MVVFRKGTLTGKQKAAVLLVSLGPELSSLVFKHLRDEEIEELTYEIASLDKVMPEIREKVAVEFSQLAQARRYITQGGIEQAKEILEKALGAQKATEIIQRLTASLQVRPFDFARKTDPAQLLNFIQHEHPQTIALILAYLHPEQAAVILSALPGESQVEVAKRLAILDRTSPEVLEEIEATLEKKLSSFATQDFTMAGGLETAVSILNRVDRSTEKTIMEALEEDDPELAEEIKKRMFVFEDIVTLDDRSIQRVLREVDSRELALALKAASEEVAERIYKNMSKRAAEMMREDIEYMGPVRLRDVEEAQQKIVSIIRKLEEAGEIIVARGGEDEIIV
ncbi:MAG: flagellar motor switch protein FliG [Limnochordia bacterium]|jgi:flagellar motor switch protein FliG|nr:flagellar motor switch protein FliG [Bacillota bacterium]